MVNRVVVAYENYQKQYQTKTTKLTTGTLNNSKKRCHDFIVTRLFAEVALDFYLKRQVSLISSRTYINSSMLINVKIGVITMLNKLLVCLRKFTQTPKLLSDYLMFRIPSSRDETQPEYLKLFQNQEFQINYPMKNIQTTKERIKKRMKEKKISSSEFTS